MSQNENQSVSTHMDDNTPGGPTEQELLDAVMKNSAIIDEVNNVPLPAEEEIVQDPADSEEVADPEESEEVVSEDDEEETEEVVEEVEGEDAPEEGATEVPEVLSADDLDLDAKVMVKVDGTEAEVSFGDLLKGYQTDAHLSKKGRELSEAQKALDAEKAEKLEEVTKLAEVTNAMLTGQEQKLAKDYHDIEAKIEKARKEGDTFELGELKDKREQLQKEYWTARNTREGMMKEIDKQKQEALDKAWKEEIDHFHKEIPNLIPDFNEKVAQDIRDFAIEKGIRPEVLNQITDPAIVKFVNDFRILDKGLSKGAAKRKVIPTKKALPTKKAKPAVKKAEDKAAMVKARAFKEDASSDDQMAFLKQLASNSLNNI